MSGVAYAPDRVVPRDVMVDLETLGTGPGCAILSIGAVAFDLDAGRLGAEFHTLVSTTSCREFGLREEGDTRDWWARQSVAARKVVEEASTCDVSLTTALERLAAFIRSHGGAPRVRLWGNGADFDNAILADLYRRVGHQPPWNFWNSRCFRTLKSLASGHEPDREGTHHNALDDARHQALWACHLFAAVAADGPQ